MDNGWIKLHRKLTEWEWYKEPYTRIVFEYVLLVSCHKEQNFRGIKVGVGEALRTLETIAFDNGITIQNARTAIKNLKSTGELTEKQHGKYRILRVNNYSQYQVGNTESNSELTASQQGSNSIQECNKEKKEKKEPINRFTPPTIQQVEEYFKTNNGDSPIDFFDFYESKGWMVGRSKMKKWEAAASRWIRKNNDENPKPEMSDRMKRVLKIPIT